MSAPRVVAVAPGSPAGRAGVLVGDEVVSLDGEVPRDVIAWRLLADRADVEVELRRGGLDLTVEVPKHEGEPLGIDVHSAVFDAVRTCDNHCEFCFIYQLPAGMRKSLYLKDDDYRLSFLYGNFTTLTRFTEADLERVVTERLSPLNVSIHATDPDVRAALLRNRRGATSLRWLRALLDHGVTVHGQVVVCPGVNDGAVLDDTMVGVLDRYPDLASVCVVPLGVSRFNTEARMRPHTRAEACAVLETVHEWQATFATVLGRRMVYAADEYYLLAGCPFPAAERYDGFPMHEDGIGMARTFEQEFLGHVDDVTGPQRGFFAWVDRTPPNPSAYTALRTTSTPVTLAPRDRRDAPVAVLTAPYGASVLEPLVARLQRRDVRLIAVENDFFGGNIAVTGLMVGADLVRVLGAEPESHRYLLPDVCLTDGRFLDGLTPSDLPRPVEIVATDGRALRRALERT
jgi:putative radical SAM enzyme (TIGR03279 family)